jgi:4-amino-4-deoxy-L-arabinose transferase-like glycosyltransferase
VKLWIPGFKPDVRMQGSPDHIKTAREAPVATKLQPSSGPLLSRNTAIDMAFVSSLFILSILIINPIGNFPLNDDWAYALTVKYFVENGDYRPTSWASMTLITNILWGTFYCILTGYSFTALRFATLTLSLIGILGTYILMRDLSQPRRLAVIASLTLGFNPIYYALSNTFMTDVPFTALNILSAIFFARNLRTDSDHDLCIGTALAVAATLSRQLAISVPVAFGLSMILRRGLTRRSGLRIVMPLCLCVIFLIIFQQWLTVTGPPPIQYKAKNDELFAALREYGTLLRHLVKHSLVTMLYLGLFLMPILLSFVTDIFRTEKKKAMGVIFGIVLVSIGAGIAKLASRYGEFTMPMLGNIMVKEGIGPLTLPTFDDMPALPDGIWLLVTAICVIGTIILILIVSLRIMELVQRPTFGKKIKANDNVKIFFTLSAVIYFLPLLPLADDNFYDRYVVPVVPLLGAGLVGTPVCVTNALTVDARLGRLGAVVFLVVASLFAICGTRDYLAWNRVRWVALGELIERDHIKKEDIDGGFEFTGLYLYDEYFRNQPPHKMWENHGALYEVGFQKMSGYRILKEYSYSHWMPPYLGTVVVMQRNPVDPNSGDGPKK